MHPYSWQTSHRADGGRARLVSTPKSPTLWILVYSRILQVGTCLIKQTEEGLASYQRPHTHKKMEVRQPLLPYSLVFRLRLPRSAQRSGLRRSLRADSRRNLHVALHARARSAVPSLRPQYMGLLQTVVHIGQTLHSSISWVQSRALSVTSRT